MLNISTYIAALITFPYVSRVLNANELGTIEYVNQIVQYFMLFSLAGIVGIGTREIASSGENIDSRSKTFSSLLCISTTLTIVVLAIYLLCILIIPTFKDYKLLFFIGAAQILFATYQIEWLYRGIENFRYITVRNIAIRVIYILSLFLFIKGEDDTTLYFGLTVSVIVVNAIINLIYSRHFVQLKLSLKIFVESWKKYFKQIAILGANGIMNSFYSTFNVVYLGSVCPKSEVGYYYVSNRIMTVFLGVISAFTLVMLPRMSNLANRDNEEFNRLLTKSIKIILKTCIPLGIGLFLYAPNVVQLLSGDGYEPSILPLRIISPLIVVSALAQIVVYQIEIPLKQDKAILISSIIGAVLGVGVNLIFVSHYGVVGTALALCISISGSFVYNYLFCKRNKLLVFPWKQVLKELFMSIPYIILWVLLKFIICNLILQLLIGGLLSLLYWLLINRDLLMPQIRNVFSKFSS